MATTATDLGADSGGFIRNTDDSPPASPGGSDLSEDIDRDDDVFDEVQPSQHQQLRSPPQSQGGQNARARRAGATSSSSAGAGNKRVQGAAGGPSSKKRTSNAGTGGGQNGRGTQGQPQQQQQQGQVMQGHGDMMMQGPGVMLDRLLDVDYPRGMWGSSTYTRECWGADVNGAQTLVILCFDIKLSSIISNKCNNNINSSSNKQQPLWQLDKDYTLRECTLRRRHRASLEF